MKTKISFHAKERLIERYNLSLNNEELLELGKLICAKKSLLIARQTTGKEHHILIYKDIKIRIIWDPQESQIVTFLPSESGNSATRNIVRQMNYKNSKDSIYARRRKRMTYR